MRLFSYILLISGVFLFISCAGSLTHFESEIRYSEKEGKQGKKSIAHLKIKVPEGNEIVSAKNDETGNGSDGITGSLTNGNTAGYNGAAGELTSLFFPALVIEGDIEQHPTDGKDFVFYITRVRLFANWPNGWTEGIYEASGKLSFTDRGDVFTCVVVDSFELWDIIEGRIRYFNTYYRENDGLWKVKNRVDRITEISRILKERYCESFYGHYKRKTPYGAGFKWDIIKVLFPERYNFNLYEKKGSLPDTFYAHKDNVDKKIVWGADLWWRSDYTKAVFPEELRELRDSGTLWRDFEEAPLLFYSLYNVTYFFNTLLPENRFIHIQ